MSVSLEMVNSSVPVELAQTHVTSGCQVFFELLLGLLGGASHI